MVTISNLMLDSFVCECTCYAGADKLFTEFCLTEIGENVSEHDSDLSTSQLLYKHSLQLLANVSLVKHIPLKNSL